MVFALIVCASSSQAGLVAASPDTLLTNRGDGPYTIGFDFTVDAAITINALGVEDSLDDGLVVASEAGLWDITNVPSVLLASVVIPEGTGAFLEDGFRYLSIGQEIVLQPGSTYRLGGVVGGSDPFTDIAFGGGGGSGFSGAGVTLLANRFAVGTSLLEPVNDGTGAPGRWVGANATLLNLDDTDGDGMLDSWEDENGLDKNDPGDAAVDEEPDGLTNLQEFENGTDPNNPDSDGDDVSDGDEVSNNTNPNRADTDGDGLSDGDEILNETDPNDTDSDDDGITDGAEVANNTDPNDPDDPGVDPRPCLVESSPDTLLTNRAQGPFVVGFDFTVDAARTVGALGVEDDNGDGLNSASEAGLWDITDVPSVELARVVIPAGAGTVFKNGFRYVATDSPVDLLPGRTYRIGAVVSADIPFTDTDPGSAGSGSGFSGDGVTILANRYEFGEFLIEPVQDGAGTLGRWAGANAIFDEVEPPAELSITDISINNETDTLTLTWNSRSGENYSIEFSQDMTDWSGIFAPSVDASTETQTSFTADRPGLSKLFFRVRVNE